MERIDLLKVRDFQIANIFGVPVLVTSTRVDPHTFPENLFLYEVDMTDVRHETLCERAGCYKCSVISASKITLRGKNKCRKLPSDCTLFAENATTTLEEYCKVRNVEMSWPCGHISLMAPKLPDEEKMFYAFSGEEANDPVVKARIGHLRIDFGRSGDEFWHTWWEQHGNGALNDITFETDLNAVMDRLRTCVLKDLSSMRSYCYSNGTPLPGGRDSYGFVVETEKYKYFLRCMPVLGDYNAYLTVFKKSLLPEV